ncbi:molybdopterin converting factor subunit 1 [Kordiimonas sp. SCSIO 12610]|uniref:molybdopterin converting factor subunit 1 n=1 Tax=Kordiimonas sp. SCSIO 12610 TaxID=2829597 RepID=UPI00210BDD2B|nr:molybdopterin converting factor subunit 1 [Kordiimonas sp. SCSIO 12610]UTW56418.1 molybdopterin converting factor subunit 1 [Kordiimonas sp. SCSIO 12610]
MANILYFGALKERLGLGEEVIEITEDLKTVQDLAMLLRARGGEFEHAFESTIFIRAAVNQTHAKFDSPITNTDEIAFFPPVTGG